ncbi:MAG: YihY/virulence factor BrkB family protein [Beutenbergiaceae bacterium]
MSQEPAASSARPAAVGSRVKRLLKRGQQTRIARALGRYGAANGPLLTKGVAFSALFSIFAGLVVAFSVFMAFLGSNTELRNAVLEAADTALPGVIDTGSGGLVKPDQLQFDPSGSIIAAIVGFLLLVNTALGVMSSLRIGIGAMFGVIIRAQNAIFARLRALAGFVVLAAAVIATSALGIAVGAAGAALADVVGLAESPVTHFFIRLLGILLAAAVDMAVAVFLIRGLGGVRPPRRDLLIGAAVTAVAAGLIRFLGTTLVSSVADNPLLAGAAAVVTLLLWVNLVVMMFLMACAWTANPPATLVIDDGVVTHATETPNYVTQSEPATLAWQHDPITGRVQPDDPPPPEPYWGGAIGWMQRKYRAARDA